MSPTNEIKPKSLSRDQLVVEDLGSELMIYDQKNVTGRSASIKKPPLSGSIAMEEQRSVN
jgi:hypothetical protein